MKIIMISIDASALNPESYFYKRLLSYAQRVEELHVVVYTPYSWEHIATKTISNLYIHPSNSKTKIDFIFYAIKKCWAILNHIWRSDVVITTQDPFETWLIGLVVKKIYKIALNIQIHTDPFSKYFRYESILNFIRYIFFRYVLLWASDSVRTVSSGVAHKIEQLGKKWFVTNIPIVHKDLKTKQRSNESRSWFTILSISRLEKVKNIEWIIDAVEKLIITYPDIRLNIVGRWTQEERLKNKVNQLDLSGKITFYPWTNDVGQFYSGSDIFILNSYYEWWGLTVIEAATAWVPIIMTNTGCAWDFIVDGHNGSVIEPWDHDALIHEIKKLYSDAELRKRYISNAQTSLKELYTEEETISLYVESWENASRNYH